MPIYIKINKYSKKPIDNFLNKDFNNKNTYIQNKDLINFKDKNIINYNPKININDYKNYLQNYNIGIPCGINYGNDIIVIDIDFMHKHNNIDENPFIKKFGYDFVNKFDTFTQKTCSGGIHLFFKYDHDLSETSINTNLGIDLLSNEQYCMLNGSEIYGNKYSVFLDKPIKHIPKELKDFIIYYNYNNKHITYNKDQINICNNILFKNNFMFYICNKFKFL